MVIKHVEKKVDGNYTKTLCAILNKSWKQNPTKQQLFGHLSPISKTIKVRRARHAGRCWRRKNEFICDVLLWIPLYGPTSVDSPARTSINSLADTGCSLQGLPGATDDRNELKEREGGREMEKDKARKRNQKIENIGKAEREREERKRRQKCKLK